MSRAELLRRLESSDPLSAETCFVLLWTYLNLGHVVAGENLSRSKEIHPFRIEAHMPTGGTVPQRLVAAVKEIQELEGGAFDLYGLRWLKALDLLLNVRQRDRIGEHWILGLDGVDYKVRRRNLFLAETFQDQVTTKKHQSGTKDLYTPFHAAVPKELEGILIDSRSDWGDASLHLRLLDERDRFRVMLWPLQTVLDYPAFDDDSDFVWLTEIRNESALQDEIRTALENAKALEVSLLVFPELAIPPASENEIRRLLAMHGTESHPLLTLFGCCLRQTGDEGFNQAVLLGPDGTELHRHTKLTSFTLVIGKEPLRLVAEPNTAGSTISVLECAVGNLTPLICLDFIHPPLFQVLACSHANLFAVPSLSNSTGAHRTAAVNLQTSNRASSFVSNRSIGGLSEEATSFFRVPCKDGLCAHLPHSKDTPYLLFSLSEWLKLDKASK
jgi:Carbon-nitrogen hydrolase